nr:leaf rust 10 disease-resistance locus receptor-like protein kinase-like 2.1 [Quercus suber]
MDISLRIVIPTLVLFALFIVDLGEGHNWCPDWCGDHGPDIRPPFRLSKNRQPDQHGGFDLYCNDKDDTVFELSNSKQFQDLLISIVLVAVATNTDSKIECKDKGTLTTKVSIGSILVSFLSVLVVYALYRVYHYDKTKKENQVRIEMFLEDYKALKPTRCINKNSDYWFHLGVISFEQKEDLRVYVEDNGDAKIAKKLAIVGLWCIQWHPVDHPSMKVVVQMLEGEGDKLTMPPNPFASTGPTKINVRGDDCCETLPQFVGGKKGLGLGQRLSLSKLRRSQSESESYECSEPLSQSQGQIGYAIIPMIARGIMLGPDQPVILHLLDIE